MKSLLFAFALLASIPAHSASFSMEEVVADRSYDTGDSESTAEACRDFCKLAQAELKAPGGNFRCVFDTETRAFGRGDWRRVPRSCKLVRLSN